MRDWIFATRESSLIDTEVAVSEITGISAVKMRSHDRRRPIVHARWLLWYVAAELVPNQTIAGLSRHFERDHTSILYALRQVPMLMERSDRYARQYRDITRRALQLTSQRGPA